MEIGNVVQFIAGGPKMTVIGKGLHTVQVVLATEHGIFEHSVVKSTLRLVESENSASSSHVALHNELPRNCRQVLMSEGKPYPRSSCDVCGSMSPKWKECNAVLNIDPPGVTQ